MRKLKILRPVEFKVKYDESLDSAVDWINNYVEDRSQYHNHKEAMAYVAFGIQIALFGSIMTLDKWPFQWIKDRWPMDYNMISILGFTCLWFFIHLFIRWQLRNRRWAAIHCAALWKTRIQWIQKRPTSQELSPLNISPKKKKESIISYLVDHIIVYQSAMIYSDLEYKHYPSCLLNNIMEQEKVSTGAVKSEYLVTYGSILLYIMVILRALLESIRTRINITSPKPMP